MMLGDRRATMVVVGLFIVMAVTIASSFDTLGVFLLPLSKQFGWSRTQVSLIASALPLSSGVAMPLTGPIVDRVDARRVMLSAVIVLGFALLAASRVNSLGQMVAAYTVIGVANAAGSIVPGSLIISRWFDERRGTAMGIVFSGFAVGEMIGNLIAGNVVARHGWRAGYVVLAVVTLAVLVPVVSFMIDSGPENRVEAKSRVRAAAVTQHAALHVKAFLMIAGAYFVYAVVMSVPIVHGVPYLIGLGYRPASASTLWGVMLGASFFGRGLSGLLVDRIGARVAMAVSFAGIAMTIVLLLYAAHLWVLVAFMAGMALLGFGPPLITPVLQGQVLGLERFGVLNGIINSAGSVGYAAGPLVAGWAFDLTGSYATAIKVAAATALLGIVFTILIRRPRALQPALA
jgi:MFS family permease